MPYTHNKGFSATSLGFAIGTKNSEVNLGFSGTTIATRIFSQGSNANTVGSGTALTRASLTAAFRVYADDGGAALTGTGSVPDLRGTLSRLLITKDNSGGNVRLFALMGQLKSQNGEWSGEQVSGVHGLLELVRSAGTINLQGYGVTAGVMATVSTSGTQTLDSTAVLAGVASISKLTSDITTTGKAAAFYAGIYDTTNWSDGTARVAWPIGLYIPKGAATQGIRVGNWVAAGASGSAIPFSTGLDFYADGQLDVIGAYGESTSNLTSAYSAKVGRFRHIATGTGLTVAHETYGLVGQMVAKGTTLTHLHAGLMGTFEGQAATVVNSVYTYGAACVIARLGGGGSITGTTAVSGFSAILNGAGLASGSSVAYAACATSTSDWSYGIAFTDVNQGILMTSVAKGIASTVTTLGATATAHEFYVTVANPNNQSGTSAYFDSTYTGATAGHCYGVGSWINAGASVFSASHIIVPFEGGVYTSGANASARIVFGGQHQAILGGAPASLHAWRLNANQTVTAVIAAANPGSVGYVAGAGTSGIQVGYIPIADIIGPGVVYVRVYSSAT